jgi:cephalosporin hydroxylase
VFDTIVEYLPADYLPGHKRPWGIGNNPLTAVRQFLLENNEFEIDQSINNKLLISVAPDGYLKKIK